MSLEFQTLFEFFRLNSRLLLNCFEGVDDDKSKIRPNEQTNHMNFILCHLLDARLVLAKLFGFELTNPYQQLFDGANGIDQMREIPPLQDLLANWEHVAEFISQRWNQVNPALLRNGSPFSLPLVENTVLGAVTFLLQHEASHIGQLAFIRKFLGLPAMKYQFD